MEVWFQSNYLQDTNRLLATQTQSRIQVAEIPFQQEIKLAEVEYGELLLTVLKGQGIIQTENETFNLQKNDQVLLVEGDKFALSAASQSASFIVQTFWGQQIQELLSSY